MISVFRIQHFVVLSSRSCQQVFNFNFISSFHKAMVNRRNILTSERCLLSYIMELYLSCRLSVHVQITVQATTYILFLRFLWVQYDMLGYFGSNPMWNSFMVPEVTAIFKTYFLISCSSSRRLLQLCPEGGKGESTETLH